jgi:hypothetical protein
MSACHLTLKRRWFTDKSTIGELYLDGEFQCFTLEDTVRAVKVMKESAIPVGRYEVVISFSNRFQKFLPLLLEVPGFEGIRIHAGNTQNDTEGCILVGFSRSMDLISNSRAAFAVLMAKLEQVTRTGKVWITITDDRSEILAA